MKNRELLKKCNGITSSRVVKGVRKHAWNVKCESMKTWKCEVWNVKCESVGYDKNRLREGWMVWKVMRGDSLWEASQPRENVPTLVKSPSFKCFHHHDHDHDGGKESSSSHKYKDMLSFVKSMVLECFYHHHYHAEM